MNLYYEARQVISPSNSKTMIVCLKIANLLYSVDLRDYVSTVPLMNRSRLPPNETRWTCRVWVKEALHQLRQARMIHFKPDVGKWRRVPRCCLTNMASSI